MSSFDPVVSGAINRLHDTIQTQIEATNRQSRIMLWLTCAAIFLAIVQACSSIVQVWLALR